MVVEGGQKRSHSHGDDLEVRSHRSLLAILSALDMATMIHSFFQDRRRHLPQPPPTNSGHRSHSSGAAVLSDLREPTPDYDESIASKRSPRFELY